MYRSVTLYALRNGLINGRTLDVDGLIDQLEDIHIEFTFNQETKVSEILLNGENVELFIRHMDVNDWVSQGSAVGEVRKKMVKLHNIGIKNRNYAIPDSY
jgi:cytidylate kinase